MHFADSKFFEEDCTPKEMMISTISSIEKGDSKAIKDTPVAMGHNTVKQQQPYSKDDKQLRKSSPLSKLVNK